MVYRLWGVLGCFLYLANTNYLFRKVRTLLDYPWMRQTKLSEQKWNLNLS